MLRLLLVLMLAFDLVSSPLHRHHHDSGADGSAAHGQHEQLRPAARHIEEDDHEPSLFHSVTTLRAAARHGDGAAPAADADAPQAVLINTWPVIGAAIRPQGRPVRINTPDRPLHALHRSLPPDGRAPPLRA